MLSSQIDGVAVKPLAPHMDPRGSVTEIYRDERNPVARMIQWNCTQSVARVLRGVHVHWSHHDYLVPVSGTLILGLHDLRPESATTGRSEMLVAEAHEAICIAIPPGVCHGFYFPAPAILIYGVSEYWNAADELGCRFDCPELGIDWPDPQPILSARDTHARSYDEMRMLFAQAPRHSLKPERP